MEPCAVADAVDAFAGWHPAVTEMVGATDDGARWALHDLAPLERWHTDRAVLMGDAAHAMVPHQGQGANQTIEDAIVLADCLADLAASRAPEPALARYAERRRRPDRRRPAPLAAHGRPDAPPRRPGDRTPRRRTSRTFTPTWPGSTATTRTPSTWEPVPRLAPFLGAPDAMQAGAFVNRVCVSPARGPVRNGRRDLLTQPRAVLRQPALT